MDNRPFILVNLDKFEDNHLPIAEELKAFNETDNREDVNIKVDCKCDQSNDCDSLSHRCICTKKDLGSS